MPRRKIRRATTTLTSIIAEGLITYSRTMKTPNHVYALIRKQLEDQAQEVFAALAFDTTHKAIAWYEISRGTLTTSLVHPREVFGPAIRIGAAALVIAHNHPSGDPTPSIEDRDVTKRLKESGKILGIPILDHMIIGHDSYVTV